MFERLIRGSVGLLLLAILFHIASALPQHALSAQTAPPSNGVASLSPASFDFGGVGVDDAAPTTTFTLTNTGTGTLGSIVVALTNTDYQIASTTCGATLAAGANCAVVVSFTPEFYAPDPGALVITDDAVTSSTVAFLAGTGVNSGYTLPFEIHFDGQAIGTTSGPQTAILTTQAGDSVQITAPTTVGNAAADFTANSDCSNTIAAPGSCQVPVTFTPSAAGPRTADLTFASPTGPYVNHLTGNGAIRHLQGFTANILAPNDDGSSTQEPLPFAVNFFGTTYNSIFVNNNGNVTFGQSLSEFTPTGLNSDNGGIPIIAAYWADVDTTGASFAIPPSGVVTYGVDTVNGHTAFGVIYENVGYYSSHTDKLNSFELILIDRSDTGIAGAFDIEFDYDKIQWEVGDASTDNDENDGLCGNLGLADCTPAAVGYSNGTGDAGTNFQLNGSFVAGALLDGGPAATSLIDIGAGTGTQGRVTYQVRNGAVQSADMSLTMTGSPSPVPAGSNETYTLTASNAGPNTATNVTISDTLPTNATLVSATPSQGAACTGTAPLTCNLGSVASAANATLTIVVTVNAAATGTVVNAASVTADQLDPNTGNNAATLSTPIGASTTPTISITPTSLTFASQALNTTSASQNVVVTNTGNSAVTFTAISTSGDFAGAATAQCPTLGVEASCTFAITFTPTQSGARTGAITFTDNATGSPQTVTLNGTGAGANAPAVTFAPTSLTFASQALNTSSAAQAITLMNSGNAALTITGVTVTGANAGDFSETTTCGASVAAGANCSISVTFKPTAAGARTAAINVADNAAGTPQTVALAGTGASATPTVTVSPASLTFAAQALNTTSAPQTVTVTNTGTSAVNFNGISIGQESGAFALGTGTCAPTGTLAASASCTIAVTFTPPVNGTLTATLTIADNATGSPQTVSLTGTGGASAITISVPPGGSTTATSVPGGTAYYGLVITAGSGVNGTVTLGCTPSSPLLTCNVIPSTVTLNGGKTEVAFQIQTYCQGVTTTNNGYGIPFGGGNSGSDGFNGGLRLGDALAARLLLMFVAMLFGFAAFAVWQPWDAQKNRRVALAFAVLLLVAFGSAACSGGLAKGPNGATPAGTYTLSLSTTFNGQTQMLPNYLTLIVQ